MMTISDIFDALVALDRPYKKAVPVERALDILVTEARDGKIDKDLLEHLHRGQDLREDTAQGGDRSRSHSLSDAEPARSRAAGTR